MKSPQVPNSRVKITANLQQVKEANRNLVFDLLLRQGPLSRADLTARTMLSPTTVSSLIEDLLQRGMVSEKGIAETHTSGRKPILLDVVPFGLYVISMELMRDGFEMVLYDLHCRPVDRIQEAISDYSHIGKRLILAMEILIQRSSLEESRLGGICIGVPAMIDRAHQTLIESTILPIGPEVDFIGSIRTRFPSAIVRLENESGLCAYAEKEYGTVDGLQNLVFMDIGIGIGAGIIMNGQLYRGFTGFAGEVGHISVDIDGPGCPCGNYGCLEQLANVPALIRKVAHKIKNGQPSSIEQMMDGDESRIDISMLRRAADRKDPLVLESIDETARFLASGINSVMNLLNPQTIIIGGAMAGLGDILMSRIGTHLSRIAVSSGDEKVQIQQSMLQGNSAALGGARILLDELMKRNLSS